MQHLDAFIKPVCACDRDEANDEVKVNLLGAIGAWLGHVDQLSPSVGKRLADSLKEKDALKAAGLAATLQVRN